MNILDRSVEIPRIAVLGCGSIGRRHLANLHALGVKDLIAFDTDQNRLNEEAGKYPGLRTCSRLDDLWTTPPWAVLVSSPSHHHQVQTVRCLENGCHVFVEKPLSYSLHGIGGLVELADKEGVTTMVACNMRFHPGPARVHRLLQEGSIGELISYRLHTGSYLPDWRPSQNYRESYSASPEHGGAILDCIHELDLALWYAGPGRLLAAKSVKGQSLGLITDALAEILIEHKSGALGSVHLNYIERDYRRFCVCIGSEGTLEWNMGTNVVLQYGSGHREVTRYPLDETWQINQMYVDEMRHFIVCALENKATCNSIQANVPCLELALQARACG